MRMLVIALTGAKAVAAVAAVTVIGLGATSGYLAVSKPLTSKPKATSPPGFAISGAPPAGARLYPDGPPVPINLVFTNRGRLRLTVRSVTVKVIRTTARACHPSSFVVVRQLRARPVLPARSTKSLRVLGVPRWNWPQVRMVDRGNQNACQHARVILSFTGTAR